MTSLKKISPEWALRLGLGLMYLYSGQDLMTNPKAWTWALPYWLKQLISQFVPLTTYLKFQGAVEVLFALFFLAWFVKPAILKWVAVLATLEMAAILIVSFSPTNFLITFRDIGLLGGLAALYAIICEKDRIQNVM